MLNPWELPERAVIGGRTYPIHGDFRDILEIFTYLEDPDLPQYIRWKIALALFYDGQIPPQDQMQAMEFLRCFINCGGNEDSRPGPKLLDWEQDATMIVADVNKVAGREIRALPFLHWWTFMAWFHAIGEGQLSTVVAIREKLRQGKALEKWEKAFYRENKQQVDLKKKYSIEELTRQQELLQMLDQ